MYYRVIKSLSDKFIVDCIEGQILCTSLKKNKGSSVFVGDLVKLENQTIIQIQERKNRLIRPPLANIDQMFIVISSIPKPDFFMLDKMVINCYAKNIQPIICVNKSDINPLEFLEDIKIQYPLNEIIYLDALHKKTEPLLDLLENKLSCLAGQSGVGKSTIINALIGEDKRKTASVSDIKRGKNTSTDIELFSVGGGFIADTPGFSLVNLFDIDAYSLDLFYPEFEPYLIKCKYHRCTHTLEPDCEIKNAVENGIISKDRYNRYIQTFNELIKEKKNEWK